MRSSSPRATGKFLRVNIRLLHRTATGRKRSRKDTPIDRPITDNARQWKIHIAVRCIGFRVVDIFRSIWSGSLNAQFEIRSATAAVKKRKSAWEKGEGEEGKERE